MSLLLLSQNVEKKFVIWYCSKKQISFRNRQTTRTRKATCWRKSKNFSQENRTSIEIVCYNSIVFCIRFDAYKNIWRLSFKMTKIEKNVTQFLCHYNALQARKYSIFETFSKFSIFFWLISNSKLYFLHEILITVENKACLHITSFNSSMSCDREMISTLIFSNNEQNYEDWDFLSQNDRANLENDCLFEYFDKKSTLHFISSTSQRCSTS